MKPQNILNKKGMHAQIRKDKKGKGMYFSLGLIKQYMAGGRSVLLVPRLPNEGKICTQS